MKHNKCVPIIMIKLNENKEYPKLLGNNGSWTNLLQEEMFSEYPAVLIWQFLTPYMGVIGLYFPNFMYFSTYFSMFMIYFPKCEGKGSFPKSQIKSMI